MLSLRISLSHTRSLKVIENGTIRKLGYGFDSKNMAVSLAVSEMFSVKYWRSLEFRVRGRSTESRVCRSIQVHIGVP